MIDLGNVFILGDSYSTFEGLIPNGYDSWYSQERKNDTDVCRVEQTWWWQLLNETKSALLKNCSWSGTTVCHTGYGGADCSKISFLGRFLALAEQGFFKDNRADTVFVFGGTNDSWANSPVGDLRFSDCPKEELYSVLPAFFRLLGLIKTTLPAARLLVILNTELKTEIADGFKEGCAQIGAELIELRDIKKQSNHPNAAGMRQIKEQILAFLENSAARFAD